MKKHFDVIISAALIAGCITGSGCQNKPTMTTSNNNDSTSMQTFSNPDDAAKSSLDVLQALASNTKLNGVLSLSADEVKQLTVGRSIPMQELSYQWLLKADSTNLTLPPPSSEHSALLYPLEINNVPRTTAVVSGNKDGWKLSSAGDNNYLALLSSQKPESVSDMSVIEVPGLGVSFLRYTVNGVVLYTSDRDVPDAKIMKGEPMGEQQALQSLARYARVFESMHGKEINDKKFVD